MNTPAIRHQDEAVEQYRDRKSGSIGDIANITDQPMSKSERTQLAGVVRQRAKIAKEDVNARQAQLLAEGEAALARRFQEQDETWSGLMAEARTYMDDVKSKLDAKCAELGIPAAFRPGTELYWFSRGENADPRRRAELRKVLQSRAEATARAAKLEIDRWSSDLQVQIIAGGLAGDARELLARLPTAEALMPPLELPELDH